MYIYQDSTKPVDLRIRDLLDRMTVDEKLQQLDPDMNDIDWSVFPEGAREKICSNQADAASRNMLQRYCREHTRLGIPWLYSAEALHDMHQADGTVFPQQLTLASSWEPEYAQKMGRAIARENRARGIHEVFAPVLDLARDPRWGRTEETYGEDTYLSARMGEAVVKGHQGDGLGKKDTVLSELKHFTGYGNPIGGLNCAPTTMGRHDTYSYCMPVFEAAIRAGAANVMCSYNSIDGIPVVSDRSILTETLREDWGMPGFVRSDMTAIIMQHTAHHSAETPKEALQKAVKAGVDLQFADYSHEEYRRLMKELLDEGGITMDDLDQSVARVLWCKFTLGLFENPYTDEADDAIVHCREHLDLALDIARESAVLLKNDGILPLDAKTYQNKKIAVLGPCAQKANLGDYTMEPASAPETLAESIQKMVPNAQILSDKGCNILGSAIKPIERWWIHAVPVEGIVRDVDYGFTAEYFNGPDFSGEPVLTRLDPQINFNWIYHKPDEAVDSKQFCVRWRGTLRLNHSFDGRIGLSSPDSMRLYINDELVIDGWEGKDANRMVPIHVKPFEEYRLRVEFRNDARGVRVILGIDYGEETIDRAVAMAGEADLAIVALGDSEETSGENFDRTSLDLPGGQLDFLKEVYATGTPVVLVLNSGRPISCVWENDHIPAILQAGFNGEMGAQAAAEILFGEVNPSGHLTMTCPRTVGQIPCHYSRKPAGGRKYVEMDWNPLYPFGYGLSYTDFTCTNLRLSASEMGREDTMTVQFDVQNTGSRPGKAVPQLYVDDVYTSVVQPILELKGFTKLLLQPGETRTVTMQLGKEELQLLTADYRWVVEPGEFVVKVGFNSGDLPLEARFRVI